MKREEHPIHRPIYGARHRVERRETYRGRAQNTVGGTIRSISGACSRWARVLATIHLNSRSEVVLSAQTLPLSSTSTTVLPCCAFVLFTTIISTDVMTPSGLLQPVVIRLW